MRFESDGAMATSILPTGGFGMPALALRPGRAAVARQVDAAARARRSRTGACASRTSHVPARSTSGFFASIEMPEHPVFASTNSTRFHVAPPSVVLKTPRSCCGPVVRPSAQTYDHLRIGRVGRGCGRCARSRRARCSSRSCRRRWTCRRRRPSRRSADRPRLAGARPHDAGIGRRHGERADRLRRLLVEHRLERLARRRWSSTRRPMPRRRSRRSDRRARRRRRRCGQRSRAPCIGIAAAQQAAPAAVRQGPRCARAGSTPDRRRLTTEERHGEGESAHHGAHSTEVITVTDSR